MPNKNQIGIGLAIVIVVVIAAIAYIWPSDNPRQLNLDSGTSFDFSSDTIGGIRPVNESDHIRGNIDAPIVIIEYSDLECPFCKQFHNSMKEIYNFYGQTGEIAWVFRHFPIDSLHKKARIEAHATECAAELGGNNAFWSMLDRIYSETNSNDSLDLARLPDFAENIGLNREGFITCMDSNRHLDKIQADYNNAIESGGQGTPFPVVINQNTGTTIALPGAVPTSQIEETIDSVR